MTTVRLGPVTVAGSFFWFRDGSKRFVAHNDMYVADLDGDGAEEVLLAGFETQPNTPAEFSDISVRVFGWSSGVFRDLTSKWMPNGLNDIQGVGDVAFGDFNGDGRRDVFMSGYADMDHVVNAYQFINSGAEFSRDSLGLVTWQHGASVADINRDGFDDIAVAGYGYSFEHGGATVFTPGIYLGGLGGLAAQPNSFIPGSGVALGNFFGDGSISAVVVDAGGGLQDTRIFRLLDSSGNVSIQQLAVLPRPRLEDSRFGITADSLGQSHDVRARAVDFSKDGLLDVIVFSRLQNSSGFPEVSQVQFLKNLGAGNFEDVTDSVFNGYSADSNASYSPRIVDFNDDRIVDLFLSAASFGSVHDSTNLFLGTNDGTFVRTGGDRFSAAVDRDGGVGTLARGPDGAYHLVTSRFFTFSNDPKGTKSTVSIQRVFFEGQSAGPVVGTARADSLGGGAGDDSISGLAGNDSLSGGEGRDSLSGGLGRDTLTGGTGADVFIFDAVLAKNIDRVTDFNSAEGDRIQLDSAVFARFVGLGVTASNLVVASGKSAKALEADDYLIFDTAKGALFYDADGSGRGKAAQFAVLVGVTNLTAADFEVV